MSRPYNIRKLSPVLLTILSLACANASSDAIDGTGGGAGTSTGGSSSTGGSFSTGGVSATGGSVATGGAVNMGGAPATGGAAATGGGGTGGTPVTGACSEYGPTTEVMATGDFAVFTCPMAQSECKAEMVGEPALFECVASHVPNCEGQTPLGGSSWVFVGLCADLGMGGAGAAE